MRRTRPLPPSTHPPAPYHIRISTSSSTPAGNLAALIRAHGVYWRCRKIHSDGSSQRPHRQPSGSAEKVGAFVFFR